MIRKGLEFSSWVKVIGIGYPIGPSKNDSIWLIRQIQSNLLAASVRFQFSLKGETIARIGLWQTISAYINMYRTCQYLLVCWWYKCELVITQIFQACVHESLTTFGQTQLTGSTRFPFESSWLSGVGVSRVWVSISNHGSLLERSWNLPGWWGCHFLFEIIKMFHLYLYMWVDWVSNNWMNWIIDSIPLQEMRFGWPGSSWPLSL